MNKLPAVMLLSLSLAGCVAEPYGGYARPGDAYRPAGQVYYPAGQVYRPSGPDYRQGPGDQGYHQGGQDTVRDRVTQVAIKVARVHVLGGAVQVPVSLMVASSATIKTTSTDPGSRFRGDYVPG